MNCLVAGLIQVIEERTFVWQKRAWHLYSQANIRKPSAALRAWQGTTVANAHVLTLGTRRQSPGALHYMICDSPHC